MGFDEEEEYGDDEEVEDKPVAKKPGKKGSKKQKPTEQYLVMKELPTQEVRSFFDEETNITTKVQTIEEALTDMRNGFEKLTGGL